MTTIKVTREVEEEWEVNVFGLGEGDVVRVRCAEPDYLQYFKGNWPTWGAGLPLPVRAEAERLWETIRPLHSGTSDDGSPWGEVRRNFASGTWFVRCFYEDGKQATETDEGVSIMEPLDADWSADIREWFSAHPWPVEKVATEASCKHGFVPWTCTQCGLDRAREKELATLRADRDQWRKRAEEAEAALHDQWHKQLETINGHVRHLNDLSAQLTESEALSKHNHEADASVIAGLREQLADETKRADEAVKKWAFFEALHFEVVRSSNKKELARQSAEHRLDAADSAAQALIKTLRGEL